MRGYLAEGREQAERVLAGDLSGADSDARMAAFEAAGGIAYWQGDAATSQGWYRQALELARAKGDDAKVANALYNLSASFSVMQDDAQEARTAAQEAVEIYRRIGDEVGTARALWGLANSFYFDRDLGEGMEVARESLEIFRRIGDRFMTGWALYMMGLYSLPTDRTASRRNFEEALPIFVAAGDRSAYGLIFDGFATLEWSEGNVDLAVRLAGYAAAEERSSGTGLAKLNREFAGFFPEQLMTDPSLAEAYAEGQRLTLEQAIDLALHREEKPATV
jgi:tetratricopeptide (TPR) repeat protein